MDPLRAESNGHRSVSAEAIARASFEQALDAMLVADDERRYVDANPAACLLFGLPREELTSRRLDDFAPPDLRSSLDAIWRDFLDDGTSGGEFPLVVADGSLRTVEFRATANVLPGRHLTVLRDVTDRAASDEAERTTRAYDLLSGVLEHVHEGLYSVDVDGRISFINPAATAMLGYGASDTLVGLPAHETFHYKRPDGSGFPREECPLLVALQIGEPVEGEEWFVRKDGSMVPVSYTASAIPLPEGRGAVVAFRDVSERREREQKVGRELDSLAWLGRVREALTDGRMAVYAQHIVDLRMRVARQHELLIRMADGDGGLVLPGRFMPIAERYGLAPEVDRWMTRQGMTLASQIGTVEINLSPASLGDPGLLAAVEGELEKAALDPSSVIFEITETALMRNVETASQFVHHLAELGFRFTLDDFGTGYGSFMDIKTLPVSYLKIDMQFTRGVTHDAGNRRVIEAIVHLAKAFGQETIAEGIEDEETADLLAILGVDYGQGHLFGRPAPVSQTIGSMAPDRRVVDAGVEVPQAGS